MKYVKAIWQFVSFLFWPQQGKERRKMELLKKEHHLPHRQGTCRREPGTYHPTLYISCAEPRKQREESQTCLNYPESRPRKTIVNVPLEEVEKCMKEMGII